MHVYAGMDLHMQLGFQKDMKVKFSALNLKYIKSPKANTNRLAFTSLMHAYASMDLHMQLRFQKDMKVKFLALKPKYIKSPKANSNSLFLIANAQNLRFFQNKELSLDRRYGVPNTFLICNQTSELKNQDMFIICIR